MHYTLSHFTRKLAVPLLLLLLTVFYFWPQIVEGRVLYWGDIGLYFAPMQDFLRTNLREGRLPLWNPLILCGTPYVGNPQTWPLYPVTALLPFVSASYFLNLTVALHIWLAGIGTYLFARRALSFGRGAALLSALTFMFGGQLVSKEQFPNMVQAAAWLPWVLLCLDRLLERRRLADALRLGLVLGLQLLAAHPQMTLLSLYLAAAWGLWKRTPVRVWPRAAFLLILSGMIAGGLSAGQILPTLGLFHDAFRQKLSFSFVNRFFLPTNELGNFFLPGLHGHPFNGDWTARGNFWETCCYLGWVPCLLSVWGMVGAWRKRGEKSARFWTVVFILGAWLSLGGRGRLYQLAYLHLPGFRSFHDPARCLLWACFALSLLAGYGWGKVLLPTRFRTAAISLVLLLTFLDLAHFGRTLYPLTEAASLRPVSPNMARVLSDPDIGAHQARILAPTPGVWLRFTNYKDYEQNLPNFQREWADTLTPNLAMSYGLRDAYGYEPVPLKNSQGTTGLTAEAFYPQATVGQRTQAAEQAGVLAVKFVAVCRVNPPETTVPGLISLRAAPTIAPPRAKPSPPAFIYLSQNTRWQPRAHLASAPTTPTALIDGGPDRVLLYPVTTGADTLVLADTQAAGWLATADGVPAMIETTHGSLRAVRLRRHGRHTVVFFYHPTLFVVGLYLSLLTVLCLTAGTACAVSRKIFMREGKRPEEVE